MSVHASVHAVARLTTLAGIAWIAGWVGGCSDSGTTRPPEGEPFTYGSLVTPVRSIAVDPFFSEAYRILKLDADSIAHVAVSWGTIERGPAVRNWSSLTPHIQKAHETGARMSITIEFIHGGVADLPADLGEFPGWENPALFSRLVGFMRDLKAQFPAGEAPAYVWLGEGPDRFAAEFPGDEPAMLAFYGALSDTTRKLFPSSRIGTVVTPALLTQGQGQEQELLSALRDTLDLIGLSIYPEDQPGGLPDPQGALDRMVAEIEPWKDRPFAVLEAGYPSGDTLGSSFEKQSQFAGLVADWLRGRPQTMAFFSWSPLVDPNAALAESLAERRFPLERDAALRADFALRISSMALHRVDGSLKPARLTWMEKRP